MGLLMSCCGSDKVEQGYACKLQIVPGVLEFDSNNINGSESEL